MENVNLRFHDRYKQAKTLLPRFKAQHFKSAFIPGMDPSYLHVRSNAHIYSSFLEINGMWNTKMLKLIECNISISGPLKFFSRD